MIKIAIIFSFLVLAGCDPYWYVERQQPLSLNNVQCMRMAILSTEGVNGVIQIDPGQSYTLTGKKIPKPIVFNFESELSNGYVRYIDGKITAYFW